MPEIKLMCMSLIFATISPYTFHLQCFITNILVCVFKILLHWAINSAWHTTWECSRHTNCDVTEWRYLSHCLMRKFQSQSFALNIFELYKNHKIKHKYIIISKVSYKKSLLFQPKCHLRGEVNIKYIMEGMLRLFSQSLRTILDVFYIDFIPQIASWLTV